MDLDAVKQLIKEWSERCKLDGCAQCELRPYVGIDLEPPPGWDHANDRAAFIRRCQQCRDARPYQWIAQLDPSRVRDFLEQHPEVFALNELKQLL